MQQSCLQRISPWLFCYSVHTQLRPGLINLSNTGTFCETSAQRSHCPDTAKGAAAGGFGQITPPAAGRASEQSKTELRVKRAGRLLIYDSPAVIAKVSRWSARLFSPPAAAAGRRLPSSPRAVQGDVHPLQSAAQRFHHPAQTTRVTSNPTAPHPG